MAGRKLCDFKMSRWADDGIRSPACFLFVGKPFSC
nr:MAG TPA: hypothetical protein [Caudoviricetes sp.]